MTADAFECLGDFHGRDCCSRPSSAGPSLPEAVSTERYPSLQRAWRGRSPTCWPRRCPSTALRSICAAGVNPAMTIFLAAQHRRTRAAARGETVERCIESAPSSAAAQLELPRLAAAWPMRRRRLQLAGGCRDGAFAMPDLAGVWIATRHEHTSPGWRPRGNPGLRIGAAAGPQALSRWLGCGGVQPRSIRSPSPRPSWRSLKAVARALAVVASNACRTTM